MSKKNARLQEFRTWAQGAPYNACFVYFTTPLQRDESLFEYARKLSDAGLAFLSQRKNTDGQWEYCARRCTPAHHVVLDQVSLNIQAPVREEREGSGRRKLLPMKEAA